MTAPHASHALRVRAPHAHTHTRTRRQNIFSRCTFSGPIGFSAGLRTADPLLFSGIGRFFFSPVRRGRGEGRRKNCGAARQPAGRLAPDGRRAGACRGQRSRHRFLCRSAHRPNPPLTNTDKNAEICSESAQFAQSLMKCLQTGRQASSKEPNCSGRSGSKTPRRQAGRRCGILF